MRNRKRELHPEWVYPPSAFNIKCALICKSRAPQQRYRAIALRLDMSGLLYCRAWFGIVSVQNASKRSGDVHIWDVIHPIAHIMAAV